MKVAILAPRLDVPFKNLGPIPTERSPIPPIREYWKQFVIKKTQEHRYAGDEVVVIEKPLWQFEPSEMEQSDFDTIYVPHRERSQFTVKNKNVLYYMQSVFPWRFYVDLLGYAGGSFMHKIIHGVDILEFHQQMFSLHPDKKYTSAFDEFRAHVMAGKSKFDQPQMGAWKASNYVLFPCQLPHDHTIKYHSDVTVEKALDLTCKATEELGMNLVVKGHPVNPYSMAPLLDICTKYPHVRWITNVHIHDAIAGANAVVVVNSGTGMESLLHKKPVITFGRCEYNVVTNKVTRMNQRVYEHLPDFDSTYAALKNALNRPEYDEKRVRAFFDVWKYFTYSVE